MSSACLTQCFGSPTTGEAVCDESWTKTADRGVAQEKRPRSSDENPGNKRGRTAWTCRACTLVNIDGSSCIACGSTHEHHDATAEGAHGPGESNGHEDAWQCEHCTFLNDRPVPQCEVCHISRRQLTVALTEQGIVELSDSPLTQDTQYLSEDSLSPSSSVPGRLGANTFVLDCGCQHARAALERHLQNVSPLPTNLRELLSCMACPMPRCRKPLSHCDLQHLLPANTLQKLDRSICSAALREGVMQARRARMHLQDFAALPITCPTCPDHPEMPLAASFTSWKLQELSTALRARGVGKMPNKHRSAAQMLQKLCCAASHVCPTCPAGISKQDNEVISTAATGSAVGTDVHAAGPAGVVHQSVVDLTLSLAQHIYRLHHLLTRQHASGSTKKAPSAKKRNSGSTKGVGYGGGHSASDEARMTQNAAGEAQKRQDEADAAMTHLLSEIRACLSTRDSGQALPHALCALSQQLMLAAALRRLLQNDSLLDIGSRRSLYLQLVQLLKHLGTRSELLPVLLMPVDFDEAQAIAEGPGNSATKTCEEGPAPCCMDALGKLDKQCAVFQRSAEAMAKSADDEDMDALAIALEIASAYEQLQESCATYKKASGTADEPGPSSPGLSTSSGKGEAQKAAEAQRSLESRYVEVMTSLRFRDHALIQGNNFYFRQAVGSSKPCGKAWLLRVVQEQSSLATSLPVAWSSSIFLAIDSDNVSALRALILGPDNTPYATGAFIFDIFLPPEYPDKPPTVHFLITGGGMWRASPNLYECGKVCLSLLGTWNGPGWSPGSSTILQVLVSIQSMIFVDDTYFNEPGYDRDRNTPGGQSASAAYNKNTARGTLQHAVLGALRNPAPAFADIIREHFRMKKQAVIEACHKWLGKNDATTKAIQAELDKLT